MFAASKTGGVVASAGDPYWSSVSLLTNFENNLTFQDGSTNNFAITRTGTVNPSLNTPFSGVGGSQYFGGNGNYLSAPPAAATSFSGAFTMEAWINVSDAGRTIDAIKAGTVISGAIAGNTSGQWVFYLIITGGVLASLGLEVAGTTILNVSSLTAALNTWHHVALVRNGTTLTIYLNGTSVGSTTYGTTFSTNASGTVQIARHAYGSPNENWTKGYFSNTRVVNGTAVYTSNFTPPTAPLTAITNTSLLITGTGQGMFNNATFVDQGPNALTMSVGGSAVYSGLNPFGNTYPGSIYCPTLNDFVTGITADDLSASDWTFEAWVNISTFVATGGVGGNVIISKCVTPIVSNFGELTFAATTAGAVIYIRPTTGAGQTPYRATSAITANTWTHVAAVYTNSNTTLKLYKNGTLTDTFTGVTNGGGSTTTRYGIGQYGNGYAPSAFSGYISNARVAKTAVYTANFTPSTTPLTAITNTSLLVRGDTGAFYDLSNNGLAETGVGSPVVTTQIKKYGAESGFLNGTNSYLSIPSNTSINLSSGDWTIEGWVYWNGTNAGATFLDKDGVAASTYPSYQMVVNGSGYIRAAVGSGNSVTYFQPLISSTLLTANTWTFVAFVKNGTTLTLYQAGTNVASATQTGSIVDGGKALNVGYATGQPANSYWSGYIDDLRITKGVARYTANFTPPTATFPTGP